MDQIPDVALHDFGMYIPIGAPDEMKLGTAVSLLFQFFL
jgi:hypothetical protein